MVDTSSKELCSELKKGAEDKNHPFRYFTLATKGVDLYAGLRTVVLRATSPNLLMTFYTDKRSKKYTYQRK